MRKYLNKTKLKYNREISLAKANQYEGIILPIECDYEPFCVCNIEDEEYIFDMAEQIGWDKIVMIDFINNVDKLVNLSKLEEVA